MGVWGVAKLKTKKMFEQTQVPVVSQGHYLLFSSHSRPPSPNCSHSGANFGAWKVPYPLLPQSISTDSSYCLESSFATSTPLPSPPPSPQST